MSAWRKSSIETCYASTPGDVIACEVIIENSRISVSYQVPGGHALYVGEERSAGHFELRSEDIPGRATLHRFENAKFLDGIWIEKGDRGMWRISLGEENDE